MYRLTSDDALILQGDAVAALRQLEADRGSFAHATITSPPYFQKFDYQSGPGEIGWEDTLDGYLDALHQVLAALYAVTIPGGALFLNIGETYNNYSPQRKHSREIKSGTKFHKDLRETASPCGCGGIGASIEWGSMPPKSTHNLCNSQITLVPYEGIMCVCKERFASNFNPTLKRLRCWLKRLSSTLGRSMPCASMDGKTTWQMA